MLALEKKLMLKSENINNFKYLGFANKILTTNTLNRVLWSLKETPLYR